MERLRLEKPTLKREQDGIEYVNEHLSTGSILRGSGQLLNYVQYGNYNGWLNKLKAEKNIKPSETEVPSVTYFLVREDDNAIVGMLNVRLALNESLKKLGGNIGCGIRPNEQGKGYDKLSLYLALKVCDKYGLTNVVIDCDKENIDYRTDIQNLGAKLIGEHFNDSVNCMIEDYEIDVKKTLNEKKNEYEPLIAPSHLSY